jgi:hypothetical protein
MRLTLTLALLAGGLLVATTRAEAGELNALFDLSVRAGEGGITLGGRAEGPRGPASGILNGRLKPGGVAVDGWIDDRGRTWEFELDADARTGGLRAIVRRAPQRI